jgi:hypothetical protein
MNKLICRIVLSFLWCTISVAYANKPTVNVLTWWGYLDEPSTAKLIDQRCGATLSYDNYTSNDDMQRRWKVNQNKYDILIFSDSIYNAIKDKIVLKKSNLWKNSKKYNHVIREKYINSNFPHNIAFFLHSLTLFIWNSKNIHLTSDDTVQSIFKKAKNRKVILLDDPVEINMLLSEAMNDDINDKNNKLSLVNFKKLTQTNKIFISNEINNIYNEKDFAFSYEWSGDAFSKKLKTYTLSHTINDHLSYISTDLIAQVQDTTAAACVANVLASKEFLTHVQNKSRYFSPYGNVDAVPEGQFKDLYKKFLKDLSKLKWLDPPSSEQLTKLNQEWNNVKYDLTQSRE